MAKLFLQRHLKSQWNKLDIWAGWCDNPLSDVGKAQAKEFAEKLAKEKIDVAYSSSLIRSTETLLRIYDYIPERYPLFLHIDGGKMQEWGNFEEKNAGNFLPVNVSDKLNERYYGQIQSMNKAEAKVKYGEELVQQWRRAYKVAPPGGESGEDTYNRVMPFYQEYIARDLKAGKNVLVVGSHNSLRAIVKYVESVSDEGFGKLELEFGSLTSYEFDADLNLISPKHFAN